MLVGMGVCSADSDQRCLNAEVIRRFDPSKRTFLCEGKTRIEPTAEERFVFAFGRSMFGVDVDSAGEHPRRRDLATADVDAYSQILDILTHADRLTLTVER
jgi:hypothetical protein